MYLFNGEDRTENMTSHMDRSSYQNHILFLINRTMVIETIMVIVLFSVIYLIITTVFWFISVTWKFCKGKVLIQDEEDEILELDLPPSYSTLDLTMPEYQAPDLALVDEREDERVDEREDGRVDEREDNDGASLWSSASSLHADKTIKQRLLYERQSKLFRSLD